MKQIADWIEANLKLIIIIASLIALGFITIAVITAFYPLTLFFNQDPTKFSIDALPILFVLIFAFITSILTVFFLIVTIFDLIHRDVPLKILWIIGCIISPLIITLVYFSIRGKYTDSRNRKFGLIDAP
ncbi:MAG: hypothetical protein MUE53_04135 [Chitinophagales bacterium]|jgi:hypothetical protein|nr:hypothetical protein [Chitinophagales bacterium]